MLFATPKHVSLLYLSRTCRVFDRYWNQACQRVVMDEAVRAYLQYLANLRMVAVLLRPR
jgi:uncharacterized protein (DUF2236 family)